LEASPIRHPAPPKTGDSFREKVMIALLGFILTGVLGGMVTTWIQQRGWAWQNRVAKIDKDTTNALSAYQGASDLVNARWHATYRMTRAIERSAGPDEWNAARAEFAAADKDWAIRYTNVARDVAFYVDTPFGVDYRDKLKLVPPLACAKFELGPTAGAGLDATSARIALEVINHCNGLTKDDLDNAMGADQPAAPRPDPAAKKALVDAAYLRLDALYRTNEAMRCIIFDRALAIRQSLMAETFWGSFFGVPEPVYKLRSDGGDCLG
jgi:hypothetical protein